MKRLVNVLASALLAPALLASVLLASVPADAAEFAPRSAAVLVRAVAYDRGLKTRVGAWLDVLVVHDGSVDAAREAEKVQDALDALGGVAVQGAPLRATTVALSDVAAVRAQLAARSPDVVWVCGRPGALIEAIVAEAKARTIITIATDSVLVDRGAMLALEQVGERPRLVIQLTAARASGVDFPADLLKLARVVR